MGNNNNDPGTEGTISNYQVHTLLFSALVGVSVLMMPRNIVIASRTDSEWVIFISGFIVLLFVWLIGALMKKFPRQNIIQFAQSMVGKKNQRIMARILTLPFALALAGLWLWMASIVTRSFGEVLVSFVLPQTPIGVLMFSIIFVAAIVVSNPLVIIVRMTEFLLPFIYITLPLLVAGLLQEGSALNLLPLFQADWKEVANGVFSSLLSYSGFSILFIYMAFYQQPEKSMRTHTITIMVCTLFFWFAIVTSIGAFGSAEIFHLLYPPLELVKVTSFPGQVLDRLESLFIAIWMLAVFTTIILFFGSTVEVVMSYVPFKEKRRGWVTFLLAPIFYILAQYPSNLQELALWSQWAGIAEIIITLLFVAIFFIVWAVRERKKGEDNATTSPS
ncbi:GerAB/ArcD/ProY family transporter [Marininema halotolerans]|uniref:Spore germination protein (Amino acid permease) n=1 Tax=Marininema halotolerans TaxID=1155944 RepID=A0A1I6QF92_9BACL|nr:GerAB/ArcD/ProY family transporter [Marininema halotolerans]SFS51072.1 spore germination protein (amino acid permease) [Marininema halotolerans]